MTFKDMRKKIDTGDNNYLYVTRCSHNYFLAYNYSNNDDVNALLKEMCTNSAVSTPKSNEHFYRIFEFHGEIRCFFESEEAERTFKNFGVTLVLEPVEVGRNEISV